ncbi:hypothetical protein TNIN_499021 [Trichonephila inaurata madagascariensis]|uniref:Uncharacterized protein n=1 Tax=Trichonephila inaurata madagascariensis TaxID=2747483 RepID=A0A8X6WPT6_9ARAC|nr:hypothetical protein TNIN_499021 [Trichonephila inaurata madagascariensis]
MIFVLRVCGLYHGANCTNGNPSPAGLLRGESIFDSSILTLWTEFAEERSPPFHPLVCGWEHLTRFSRRSFPKYPLSSGVSPSYGITDVNAVHDPGVSSPPSLARNNGLTNLTIGSTTRFTDIGNGNRSRSGLRTTWIGSHTLAVNCERNEQTGFAPVRARASRNFKLFRNMFGIRHFAGCCTGGDDFKEGCRVGCSVVMNDWTVTLTDGFSLIEVLVCGDGDESGNGWADGKFAEVRDW